MKKTLGRILIVDDDRSFLDMYRDLLGDEGYEVETVDTHVRARDVIAEDRWGVILLDQKLLGPGGPDHGIELARVAREQAPHAKVIVITGFATKESIERAFEQDVYDFLEKNSPQFRHLLRIKVRNAFEPLREREMGAMDSAAVEARIREHWSAVGTETDKNKKGRLLEDLLVLLLRTIPGFIPGEPRRESADEEIDIVVSNESRDPLWSKESPYILVECKNWSKPVGPDELDRFQRKLERRSGRAKLGLFIAPGGFTSGVHSNRMAAREKEFLVICVGQDDLSGLVDASDRNEVLKSLHNRAIVEANGH